MVVLVQFIDVCRKFKRLKFRFSTRRQIETIRTQLNGFEHLALRREDSRLVLILPLSGSYEAPSLLNQLSGWRRREVGLMAIEIQTMKVQSFADRAHRIEVSFGRGNVVRYRDLQSNILDHRIGQLADVSLSGARIISRAPIRASVGEFLSVEFAIPGAAVTFKRRAAIVRFINEFVFAVRFISTSEEDQAVLRELISARQLGPVSVLGMDHWQNFSSWFSAHRQGFFASFLAFAIFSLAFAAIYQASDQKAGRLRSWGKEVPATWYWDYVQHLPKYPGRSPAGESK